MRNSGRTANAQARQQPEPAQSQAEKAAAENDWTQPRAMALPKEGYFKEKQEAGRFGPTYPKTPACHGFTLIAKVKPGRRDCDPRAYMQYHRKVIGDLPEALATLQQLHYSRCSSL